MAAFKNVYKKLLIAPLNLKINGKVISLYEVFKTNQQKILKFKIKTETTSSLLLVFFIPFIFFSFHIIRNYWLYCTTGFTGISFHIVRLYSRRTGSIVYCRHSWCIVHRGIDGMGFKQLFIIRLL